MDPVRNPFAPGAGSKPPELAGRNEILDEATIALQRAMLGRHSRSQILLGLRGVGKTVLLIRVEEVAQSLGHLTSFIEAPEESDLARLLYPRIRSALLELSVLEKSKSSAAAALRALKGFASAFKIEYGGTSISIDVEPGVADSGNLEFDLTDLFVRVGEAAQAAGRAWTLLIDEVQYLRSQDFSALIVAIHRVNQKNLPVLFFGAGLPQAAALSGEAKSYAERLFSFPPVGALSPRAAEAAIRNPIKDEEEEIEKEALSLVIQHTRRYPYFLQEWGYHAWNIARCSPITVSDILAASLAAEQRLDEGFFKVRFDRLSPREREYVCAMAKLGKGPYKSSDIADHMGDTVQNLGPVRLKIIRKGMIYSPSFGEVDFTVPLFDDYVCRNWIKA